MTFGLLTPWDIPLPHAVLERLDARAHRASLAALVQAPCERERKS